MKSAAILMIAAFFVFSESALSIMKNYLQSGDKSAQGLCRNCQTKAPYTAFSCDNCGSRLPWADGVASRLGEDCPNCQEFNVYTRQSCAKCGELLPWKDAAAAKFHASHDSDKEFRLDITAVLIGSAVFVFGFMALLWSVARH